MGAADAPQVLGHDFRKAGLTVMDRAGGEAIGRRFLGHEPEQDVTQTYTQATDDELERVFRHVFDS